jgi:hypothetical protein
MESDALDGWWWLPDRHDHPQFGRLCASRSGRWKLDVFGGLEDDSTDLGSPFRIQDEMAAVPLIHGHLREGVGPRFITLIDCRQQSANRTFGGAANEERTESWTFDEVVTGFDNVADDERVVEFRVRLSSLLEWTGRRRPDVEWSDEAASVTVTTAGLGSAQVPGASLDLVLDWICRDFG